MDYDDFSLTELIAPTSKWEKGKISSIWHIYPPGNEAAPCQLEWNTHDDYPVAPAEPVQRMRSYFHPMGGWRLVEKWCLAPPRGPEMLARAPDISN
jgi:hypothetical protein